MGSNKDYIALPTDEKSLNSPTTPPPPYENQPQRFPLRWKVICLLLTLVGLTVIGFCIHPNREHGHFAQVDLGFPQDIQQHNLAQEALTGFMTRIVHEAEKGPHAHDHHRPHHHRHRHKHHEKHHDQYQPQSNDSEDHPHHGKHHHHPHGKHHHHHHPHGEKHHKHHHPHGEKHHKHHHRHQEQHQKRDDKDETVYIQKLPTHHRFQPPTKDAHERREDDDTVYIQKLPTHHRYQPPATNQKRENDDFVYIQKLPTHHRYQPPTKHSNQRRDLTADLNGGQATYRLVPSANTSLHILAAHVHSSLTGDVTVRQDTTGIEQDIVITFRTSPDNGVAPIELSTRSYDDAFFLRARSASHHDTANNYSIDITFPSNVITMKNLNIHINNGTIHSDDTLQVAFESTKLSVNYGAMLIQKLTADRIMLGTYSGVIAGTFQPKDRFAVGAYYGHSNVRLLQLPASLDHCRHLHIAAASPHGVSEMTLEHGAFDGQFVAYRTLKDAPKVNFTSNDKQLYDYQVVDQRHSGWFINNSAASQLILHGRDESILTFE